MKEMNYAEMQNVNGGWIGWVIAAGVAIWIGGWELPKWVQKLIDKNKNKYTIK